MQQQLKNLKTIKKIFNPQQVTEGDGILLLRVIGTSQLKTLDPFLMLDYFASNFSDSGLPDHPHRGFSAVSYIKQGESYHEDFLGNKGKLEPGDVQWMTAGKGIVHAEIPAKKNQYGEGFQLWVNLEKKDKLCDPFYQEVKGDKIPVIKKDGVSVKLISGESMGQKGPINPPVPTFYMDVTIEPNTKFEQLIPKQWNCLVFIYDGDGKFGEEQSYAKSKQGIVLNQENQEILLINSGKNGVKFMIMAGRPINEPIAWHGPFVMNTQEELYQAFEDYQQYKNGFEHRKNWKSQIQFQYPE